MLGLAGSLFPQYILNLFRILTLFREEQVSRQEWSDGK